MTESLPEGIDRGKFLYARLLWNNLGVHPLRSALSAVAIGLQVFLILFIVGLTRVFSAIGARAPKGWAPTSSFSRPTLLFSFPFRAP